MHTVLLPTTHPLIEVEAGADEVVTTFRNKRWVFPREDCMLLPIANTTKNVHYTLRFLNPGNDVEVVRLGEQGAQGRCRYPQGSRCHQPQRASPLATAPLAGGS